MKLDIEQSRQLIANSASDKLGVEVEAEWVEFANPASSAHLALPCFRFASILSKTPPEIADSLAKGLEVTGFKAIKASGAYVNFWFDELDLCRSIDNQVQHSLTDSDSNNKTAIVEYLSPNLAKPLSIGHLRNILQGRAAVNFYKNAGYKVITDNHIGDWGTVFGMWVLGFQKFSSDQQLEEGGVKELGRVYVEMRKALKSEEADSDGSLAQQIQDWLAKLENGDSEALKYHQKFSEISLANIDEQMKQFDIEFDYSLGESFYINRGKEMVGLLLESGIAVKNDDNSVVINLDDEGIETPMLIAKSNGSALYATSDIATIDYREKTWQPDMVIYVVGAEQQFYFKQLFAANKIAGWSDATLVHHWYGLIEELDEHGKRSKMSSRKNAVFLSDLLQLAIDKASDIADDQMNDEDIKKIAYGALTFQEFSASHTGNTLFDWDKMFSLSGYSGPYVQYAVVRINSVLSKVEHQAYDKFEDYDWAPHSNILWLLNRYDIIVNEATKSREYNKLADFSYQLAREWNRFYEQYPILNASDESKQARLWLAKTIGRYLDRSLYLLGIKIPSRM